MLTTRVDIENPYGHQPVRKNSGGQIATGIFTREFGIGAAAQVDSIGANVVEKFVIQAKHDMLADLYPLLFSGKPYVVRYLDTTKVIKDPLLNKFVVMMLVVLVRWQDALVGDVVWSNGYVMERGDKGFLMHDPELGITSSFRQKVLRTRKDNCIIEDIHLWECTGVHLFPHEEMKK